ncbi:MAG: hypothetical protein K2Y56_18825 [Methylobacterium sp.]|uniref:sigma factor n=1 Tax=Methylobacterium sp. TaxID=409 RepID=UPI003454B290|nr:hypothetical protein [Methylobacterium sp.]
MSYHSVSVRGSRESPRHVPRATATRPESKPADDLQEEVRAALVRNRASFLRYLRRRLRTAQAAEDALQDFCVRALQSSDQLADCARVDAWLRCILRSTLIDLAFGHAQAGIRGPAAARRSPRTVARCDRL